MSQPTSRLEQALGVPVKSERPLSGGCVAKVSLVQMADGRRLVVKEGGRQLAQDRSTSGHSGDTALNVNPSLKQICRADSRANPEPVSGSGFFRSALALEGWMLTFLKGKLPVPEVLLAEDDLLVMTYIEAGAGGLDDLAQEHCAELVASLHAHTAPAFGLERDTLIGGLAQPNLWTESWLAFFRDRRLLFMAERAFDERRLPREMVLRLEKLAGRLGEWLEEPPGPSLVHGDLWGGNILADSGRVMGFVDPAIYYADPEIELAFGTMFGTLGPEFFARYGEIRPIRDGFFDIRRHLYNLYPTLVHVRLFGDAYLRGLDATLRRFGA